jgi:biopolymer transport protein ExbD
MFFYNPKSRRSIRIEQSKFNRFGRFWQFRRFDQTELNKVTTVLFFFFFAIIALRIGGISFFAMTDFGGIVVGQYSVGINKPYAKSAHKPIGSSRHLTYLSMDRYGNLKLNGKKCLIDEIASLIELEERMDPQMIIALIIDEETIMEKVNEMLYKIKGERYRRLSFMTSRLDK